MEVDAEGQPQDEAPSPTASRARVLVVDDTALVRRTVTALLEEQGYAVETASSGEQAFARCLAEPFDLVVSDVTMQALSGMQLCWLLRHDEVTASMPIVLLTAEDDPRYRFWARHSGADAYVIKEHMRSRLAPTVAEHLEAPAREPDAARPRSSCAPAPLHRLAQILEDNLFHAVLSGEVNELVRYVEKPAAFMRGIVSLAAEVASYGCLTVRLDGPAGTTAAIHARSAFPAEITADTLAALGLAPMDPASLKIVRDGPSLDAGARPELGEPARFPVRAADEALGELAVFPEPGQGLRHGDRRTIERVAAALGVVVKALFLFQQTQRLADTDPLTGLLNRRAGMQRLEHEIDRARRSGRPFCVALCDLDHFKRINDEHGHAVGDEVLRVIARELEERTRTVDMVSRWGGEELLVLLTDADVTGGCIVGKRLRIAVERASRGVVEGGVTMSVGVAAYEPGIGPEALVDRADRALYGAKERGRNTLAAYDEDGD